MLLVSWLLVFPQQSLANAIDPSSIGSGARSIAMGRTGDNPANLASAESIGLSSMQTKIAEDVNYTLLNCVIPTAYGKFGLGYLGSSISGIQTTALDNAGRPYATGSFDYSNNLIELGFGKVFNNNFSYGGTFKFFSRRMGASGEASGYDADFGLLYRAKENLTLGFSIQNALPSFVSGITWSNGTKEDLLTTLKFGGNYRLKDYTIAVDLISPPDTPFELHEGIEWKYNPYFALRGGLEHLPVSGGYATNYTLGLGLTYSNFSFDYSYFIDNTLSANSTNYISLSYLFPQPAPPPGPAIKKPVKPAPPPAKNKKSKK